MSNETPCSSSSFSSKGKENSVCFDKDNQKLQKLKKTCDIYRTVYDESDNDEEDLSCIKQKLTFDKMVEVTNRISSGVWKYFKGLSSEDGNHKVCQVDGCRKIYVNLTSTHNMNNHLISTHKIQPQEE
ncbi:hypothetical protein BpHYR1_018456 [Brachionus plicatilis]|uniref:BED-type domain-containing protein n=1 Tax=Brachionus plicatilis TaxID=10195 RepID=A0A3M7SG31_BRAPC|nr:hypothetical protein BpHYR1_018456 [Brachionus plicatilis]